MKSTQYDLFARHVSVVCDPRAEQLGAFIEARWQRFVRVAPLAAGPGDATAGPGERPLDPDLVFHLHERSGSRLREWQFFSNDRVLVIADDRRLITGYFHRRPWHVHIEACDQTVDDVYYYMFEPLLLMTLARLGLVHWHSGAVSLDGAAVLLAGPSGSGKSTTTLRFLESGFAFVADDEIFLEHRADGIAALGVDGDIHVTDNTLAMFPRLDHLKSAPLVQRGHGLKRSVPVSRLYAAPATCAAPAATAPLARVVLFPTVCDEGQTRLERLPSAEAVRRFLSHRPKEYPTLVTDGPSAQRRLDTYVELARTVKCFDVRLGRDAASLPRQIEAYLQ
ncbi:MAG: hypothetical protein AB7J63_12315 [Vicinamibacterales bacterium]